MFCLLPRLRPIRVVFVQIDMMSIVNETVEVATGGSSTIVLGSPCRGAMNLEVIQWSPDVDIAPRKGMEGCGAFLSLSPVRVDRDYGDEFQLPLGIHSVGDHSHHLSINSS